MYLNKCTPYIVMPSPHIQQALRDLLLDMSACFDEVNKPKPYPQSPKVMRNSDVDDRL